jgi:flavin reductase (DIM6/NTAB) family NADH-FMN oxidoreductase RutF
VTSTLTVDPPRFRTMLGQFASGIVLVTGSDDDGPVGFTCQSFCSVSLDPPLVSFCVGSTSTSYPRIRRSGSFAVNVLAQDQQGLSRRFAQPDTDRWSGVARRPGPGGNPLVAGALAWLDCTITAEHPAGDHTIVVGRVEALGVEALGSDGDAPTEPLVFFRGRYRGLAAC